MFGFGEEEGKFFAAVAAEDIFAADAIADQSGCAFEDVITGEVAVGVVEFFEEVDIHEDQAEVSIVSACAAKFAFEAIEEVAFVVDGGESVGGGESVEFFVVDVFEVIAAEEFKDDLANFDAIAVTEGCFVDQDVIDVGAVGAAHIADEKLIAAKEHLGVIARYRVSIHVYLCLFGSADHDGFIAEGVTFPKLRAI